MNINPGKRCTTFSLTPDELDALSWQQRMALGEAAHYFAERNRRSNITPWSGGTPPANHFFHVAMTSEADEVSAVFAAAISTASTRTIRTAQAKGTP